MLALSADTIPQLWEEMIYNIYTRGDVMDTEYGTKEKPLRARYFNGCLFELHQLGRQWHRLDPFCSEKRIEGYREQFRLENVIVKEGIARAEYTYIERLRRKPCADDSKKYTDQVAYINEQLKKLRFESRRLVASTWLAEIDCDEKNAEGVPCFQYCWVFPRKDYRLDMHIHYRSWDAFKAFEANLNAFQDLLGQLTDGTAFIPGKFRCLADNVHIYEDDWPAVESVLRKVKRKVA